MVMFLRLLFKVQAPPDDDRSWALFWVRLARLSSPPPPRCLKVCLGRPTFRFPLWVHSRARFGMCVDSLLRVWPDHVHLRCIVCSSIHTSRHDSHRRSLEIFLAQLFDSLHLRYLRTKAKPTQYIVSFAASILVPVFNFSNQTKISQVVSSANTSHLV